MKIRESQQFYFDLYKYSYQMILYIFETYEKRRPKWYTQVSLYALLMVF